MRVAVLIPSDSYRETAGARIRYDRLVPHLAARGVSLDLVHVGAFDPRAGTHDAIILSKVHDLRGLLAAAHARRAGLLVGVDLFDDYFSQDGDPRLNRFRHWLDEIAPRLDFAITSTPAMSAMLHARYPALAVQTVRDTAERIDAAALRTALAAKLERIRQERIIRVGWYGVGDNPFFPVGLHDLVAFSMALHRLSRRAAMPVRLSILTNERALGPDALEALAHLPVPATIESWSIAREAALLDESFAIFLPVNRQPFSVAKSPNRAITALAAGCQVLSQGHDLYADFAPLLYRDPDSLADDLLAGTLRLGAQDVERGAALLSEEASSEREAGVLHDFLAARPKRAAEAHPPLAVVHGARPMLQDIEPLMEGVLSVSLPFTPSVVAADLAVQATGGPDLAISIGEDLLGAIPPALRDQFVRSGDRRLARPLRLKPRRGKPARVHDLRRDPVAVALARHADIMGAARSEILRLLGEHDIIENEQSPLPFPAGRDGGGR